jgi:ATP-dependent HslUV protease subunit HslV
VLVVADSERSLLVSGNGEVIEPDDGILAVGSGGSFALAAARALVAHSGLPAPRVVEESLRIASEICVYTNSHITVLEVEEPQTS